LVYHEHEPHASVRHLHFVRTSLDGVFLTFIPIKLDILLNHVNETK